MKRKLSLVLVLALLLSLIPFTAAAAENHIITYFNLFDTKVCNVIAGDYALHFAYTLGETADDLKYELLNASGETVETTSSTLYDAKYAKYHEDSISLFGRAAGSYKLRITATTGGESESVTGDFRVVNLIEDLSLSGHTFVNNSWNSISASVMNYCTSAYSNEIYFILQTSYGKELQRWTKITGKGTVTQKLFLADDEGNYFPPGNYKLIVFNAANNSIKLTDDIVISNPPKISVGGKYVNRAIFKWGDTSTFRYTLNTEAQTSVEVYNEDKLLMKRLVQDRVLRGAQSATWNLRNLDGKYVPTGKYFYTVSCENAMGRVVAKSGYFTVMAYNSKPFATTLKASPQSIVRNNWETIKIQAGQNHGVFATLCIKNESGAVVRTLFKNRLLDNKSYTYSWNLKNSSGKLVPAGKYTIEYTAKDAANIAITKKSVLTIKNAVKPVLKNVKLNKMVVPEYGSVTAYATLTQKSTVDIQLLSRTGKVLMPLVKNKLTQAGSIHYQLYINNFKPDKYKMRIIATNSAGTASVTTKLFEVRDIH